jgi:hypothetical protein
MKMKNIAIIAAVALSASLFSFSALAGGGDDFADADTNNDEVVSWEEARAHFNPITEDKFVEADADGDGVLTIEEFAALELLVRPNPFAPRPNRDHDRELPREIM